MRSMILAASMAALWAILLGAWLRLVWWSFSLWN